MCLIKVFVVFHKNFYPEIYQLSHEDKLKYLTFYGVNYQQPSDLNVIYEYGFEIYNPKWQTLKYNEASALYHIYINKFYEKYDFIGLFQYDMEVLPDCFTEMEQSFAENPNTIYIISYFRWFNMGGQVVIHQDFPYFESGLKTYNKLFNTDYSITEVYKNRTPSNNTFVINKNMFQKMMSWLEYYFISDIPSLMYDDDGCEFNPGHMIEGLISMFLSLEVYQGAAYKFLKVIHNEKLKN